MVNFRYIRFIFVGLIFWNTAVKAADQTFYFLSLQTGAQDTSTTGDTYLEKLSETHGSLKQARNVVPVVLSFDFYRTSGNWGSGFGIDLHRYNHTYQLQDKSSVELGTVATLFAFSIYYRGGFWFPYVGFGAGNYTAKIQESLNATSDSEATTANFTDAAAHTFHYKAGIRIPLGAWGIMASWDYIAAKLTMKTENNTTLELGGNAALFGVYYGF
ncbi:MAG: hypothetical protein HQM12_09130 [SAR324 cluster bacterium]|nr:hypothetical protein [SAR324 cluster bacterium]MBF0349940.1 hypothetical protein [SAR324 cluster bacterium]